MRELLRKLSVIDLLTAAIFVVAILLLSNPSSLPRVAWSRYRAEAAQRRAIAELWDDIVRQSSPLFGDAQLPQVVEIADYECPYCRASHAAVDSALSSGIRVAYFHLPLSNHPAARGAALAALCAESAGRFSKMHERLMTTEAWRKDSNWTREADLAGMTDLDAFQKCLDSPATGERLRRQLALVDRLKIQATPTFVSPRAHHRGLISLAQLKALP